MDFNCDKQIGINIRRLRKERQMTQEQLASQLQVRGCDVTRSAVAKMEVGQRHIYASEMKALKEIFRVSYETLFDE